MKHCKTQHVTNQITYLFSWFFLICKNVNSIVQKDGK